MNPLYKKIGIGLLILVVLGAAAYFVFWFFGGTPSVPEETLPGTLPGGTPSSTSTPPGGEGSVGAAVRTLSDRAAFDYWLVPATGEIYYLTPEGYVYIVREGDDLEISRQAIQALNHAEPSSDGRRALVSFGNPSARQWAIFDTIDSVWRPVPREITNAGWGRAPSELVATVASGGDLNLSFVDISPTVPMYTAVVRDFRMADTALLTLDSKDILIVERASSNHEGRVWRLNPTTRTLTLVLNPTAGRTVKIARGSNISYLGSTGGFSIADGSLQNGFSLFFNTLPSKCAALASTTYCFVPKNLPDNVVFPDDYFMRKAYTTDSLYMIDHESRAITVVPLFNAAYDAYGVVAREGSVYFLNRYDKRIYEVSVGER